MSATEHKSLTYFCLRKFLFDVFNIEVVMQSFFNYFEISYNVEGHTLGGCNNNPKSERFSNLYISVFCRIDFDETLILISRF